WSLKFRRSDVQRVVKLMVPRSLDQGIDQIHYIVETIIASRLQVGSLAIYYFANNLKNVPLVLIGNSVATAAFPTMASRAAKGAYETLIKEFVINARLILFLVVPAAIVTVIMRGYIVRLLYGFGDPTTANTLGWFAGAIIFQALFFLVARMFYALQDSKTPLYVSVSAIIINIPLSIGLSNEFGVVGLAMAQSVLAVLEVVVLTILLQRRMEQIGLESIWAGLWRMLLAGAIMIGSTYIVVARVMPLYATDLGFIVVAPKFFGILAISLAAYFIPCYLLDLHEARKVYGKLKEQILKPLNLT
ncbi:MAG TPA: lipid II flippase MurJ, partial [Candidatus Saccharimonadia bacterium]